MIKYRFNESELGKCFHIWFITIFIIINYSQFINILYCQVNLIYNCILNFALNLYCKIIGYIKTVVFTFIYVNVIISL